MKCHAVIAVLLGLMLASSSASSQDVVDVGESREEALARFMAEVGQSLAIDETSGGIHVSWNYSGAISSLWVENGSLSFDCVGCRSATPIENIYCVFEKYPELFGVNTRHEELLLASHDAKSGGHFYTFNQAIGNIPVFSSSLRVILTPEEDAISGIFSSVISGAYPIISLSEIENTNIPEELPMQTAANIAEIIGHSFTITNQLEIVFLINRDAHSLAAVPVLTAIISSSDEERYRVRTDLTGNNLVDIEELARELPSTTIKTRTAYPAYSEVTCSGTCTGAYDYCMNDPYIETSVCVDKCESSSECWSSPGMDATWDCEVFLPPEHSDFSYMCNQPNELSASWVTVYDSELRGWQSSGYEYSHYYSHAFEMLDAWVDYMDFALGRDSWDDDGASVKVRLYSALGHPSSSASGGYGFINIKAWNTCLAGTWSTGDEDQYCGRYQLFGHEGMHSITQAIAGDIVSDDECVSENMSDMMGSLFSRSMKPTQTWTQDCGVSVTRTTIGDSPCGNYKYSDCHCDNGEIDTLFGNSGHVPYSADRSWYDALPCPGDEPIIFGGSCNEHEDCAPYQHCGFGVGYCTNDYGEAHNNGTIWVRFARLLSEGSTTFSRDGFNEDVGVSFSGTGNALAAEIITYALETSINGNPEATRRDVVDGLLFSGSQKGKLNEVKYSLGAIGLPGATYYLGGYTDRAPRAITWPDWPQAVKYFFVYKVDGGSDIEIKYHNGSQYVTVTISGANADESPTAEIFNGKLHVFWRDHADNSIMVRYYDTDLSYSQHDLASLALTSEGAFDAVVFQGDLYLGFVKANTDTLHIARCVVSSGGCDATATSWQGYGSPRPTRYRNTTYKTGNGIALASGANLNGGGTAEYLYALLANPEDGSEFARLRVLRIDASDNVDGFRWISSTYPSYRSDLDLPRGIEMRESAFSGAPFGVGNYLYLAWNDYETDKVYTSILQDWGYQAGTGWFTRPFTLLGDDESTNDGVTIWRGDSDISARYLYKSSADTGKYQVVYCNY